jgi:hypothetical protein
MGLGAGQVAKDTDFATLSKIIAWGSRSTSSTGTTSEVGVLRLDGIAITSGHMYRIYTGPLALYSNVTSDTVAGNIRTSAAVASTPATTASPALGQALKFTANATSTSFPETKPLIQVYTATLTGLLSVLLTVSRMQGTGTVSIQTGCDMWVEEIGLSVGNTGVAM